MNPVTITVHRVSRDGNGDPLPNPPTHTVEGVIWFPRTSSESDDRGEQVVVGMEILPPYDPDILATDQVTLNGELYDVEGEVGDWSSPFSEWTPGSQVALVRSS